MPQTTVVFYQGEDGRIPLLEWFEQLVPKARAKCRVRLGRLAELGHELRRPEAGLLRDGIYELRAKHANVNYRMLYFFHGEAIAVVSHGFVKQRAQVSERAIALALRRREAFETDPYRHTYGED